MAAPWSIYAKSDAPAGNYALVTTVTTPFTLTAVVNKADRATSTPSDTDILDATLTVQPQVVPAKPTGLTATGGDASITLGWDDPDDNSITGYEYFQAWEAKLTASDGAVNDEFGHSVAVDGDTVVVGAHQDNDNGTNSGSAYLFTKPKTDGWTSATQTAKLTASDGAGFDVFGYSVAVDGDTVVVGAYRDDDNGFGSGSAYLFTKPDKSGWATDTETAKLTASDGAVDDYFGYSVAVDGDTVVVGAYWDDGNDYNYGSAYLFTKPDNSGWATDTETAKLTASDKAVSDEFGHSVAVDGDTVVVGAYQDDDNGSNSGSAYLFTKPNTGRWTTGTQTAKLTASDGADFDLFGYSVAVEGDTVVAGAYLDDDNGSGSGSAYAFTISPWTAIPNSETGGENASSYTLTGLTGGVTYTH